MIADDWLTDYHYVQGAAGITSRIDRQRVASRESRDVDGVPLNSFICAIFFKTFGLVWTAKFCRRAVYSKWQIAHIYSICLPHVFCAQLPIIPVSKPFIFLWISIFSEENVSWACNFLANIRLPPRTPDLTPCEICLKGYLKSKLNQNHPQNFRSSQGDDKLKQSQLTWLLKKLTTTEIGSTSSLIIRQPIKWLIV